MAAEMKEIVPINTRNERNKQLRNLSYMKQQYFNQQFVQQTRKVLFEDHIKNGMMEGYTDNYIRITAAFRNDFSNQVVDWKL